MNALFAQLSGLAGIMLFLSQLWSHASIERSLTVSAWTALLLYLLLVVGRLVMLHVANQAEPADASPTPEPVEAAVTDAAPAAQPSDTALPAPA